MFKQILEQIGLPTKEALVYEALLKLGETSVKPLLRETGLKRGNLYDILYSLQKRELCELIEIGKKTHFRPTSPNNLNKIAETKQQTIQAAQKSLGDILPQLNQQFQSQSSRPYVAYYVGLDGIKKVYDIILEAKPPLLQILASHIDKDNPELSKLIEKQVHKQELLGIKTEALGDESDGTLGDSKNISIKKLSNFKLPSQIIIFNNSVAISALKPYLLTTYIESPEIAQTLKTVFTQLWHAAAQPSVQAPAKTLPPNI